MKSDAHLMVLFFNHCLIMWRNIQSEHKINPQFQEVLTETISNFNGKNDFDIVSPVVFLEFCTMTLRKINALSVGIYIKNLNNGSKRKVKLTMRF